MKKDTLLRLRILEGCREEGRYLATFVGDIQMVDLTTLGIAGGIGYVGKDVVNKILGPTAEYLGQQLKEYAQKRLENTGKIFSNAEKKLGDKLDRPGQVPPKVLKTILNEGSYADDAVATEYFGGVLASSRTEVGRDDRGSRLAKMIDNMSAYQLRSHYLIYSTISKLFSNSENSFHLSRNRRKIQLFIPVQDYVGAMAFTQQEWDNPQMLQHILHGLAADELIAGGVWGGQEDLKKTFSGAPSAGIICTPTVLGAELLLWAFGHGDKNLDFLLTDDFSPEIEGIPKSVSNALAIQNIETEGT